jgi:methionyl-tRNA formyltransferase
LKVLIFSLGLKGYGVVKALAESLCHPSISCIIGKDVGVADDWSDKLVSYCEQQGIDYVFRGNNSYKKDDYDLFLAVGWRWIIKNVPHEKLIVFHDSLLPKYRGFAPLVSALINKEKITGVTALIGAEEYDRGNILLQKSLDIDYPTDIEREIRRISTVYVDLALELFVQLNNGAINRCGYPQEEKEATYSLWLDDEDYRINWNDDASNIEHFINCVGHPYKGASAMLNFAIVRVRKAWAREDVKVENRTSGKVIFVESGLPVVVCGKGLLVLVDVQNEVGESILPLNLFRSRFC